MHTAPMPLALHVVLPVELTSARRARLLLTDWLTRHGCHADAVQDLVYAASEAVTNSVEHAFIADTDGVITLEATALPTDPGLSRVTITVTDTGRWRPPPTDNGTRGRGLSMIARLVENLHIETTAAGTRVQMTGHPC